MAFSRGRKGGRGGGIGVAGRGEEGEGEEEEEEEEEREKKNRCEQSLLSSYANEFLKMQQPQPITALGRIQITF